MQKSRSNAAFTQAVNAGAALHIGERAGQPPRFPAGILAAVGAMTDAVHLILLGGSDGYRLRAPGGRPPQFKPRIRGARLNPAIRLSVVAFSRTSNPSGVGFPLEKSYSPQ